ncbi:hypothetical protein Ancab_023401 [Ancistrocladus abbreviatus]
MEKQSLSHNKPNPSDLTASAHLLESQHIWRVLNTISSDLGGAPFGKVTSFSDGHPGDGYGVPYFYLTPLDPIAKNALKDSRSSLAISELPLGTSGEIDPENPTCGKMTLTGKLKKLESGSGEAELGRKYLFSKHPEMKDWPKDGYHGFQVFKLDIEDIYLLNWYGPAPKVPVEEYLKWKK